MADNERWHEDDDPGGLGCWLWTGWTDNRGNPGIHLTEGMRSAARWVWEREEGPIPEGVILGSYCEERLCVRPRHHFPAPCSAMVGTRSQARLNRYLGKRARELVMEGHSRRWLARQFDVSEWTIRAAVNGTHWTQRRQ